MHEILGTDSSITVITIKHQLILYKRIEECYLSHIQEMTYMAYARLDGTLEQFCLPIKGKNGRSI